MGLYNPHIDKRAASPNDLSGIAHAPARQRIPTRVIVIPQKI